MEDYVLNGENPYVLGNKATVVKFQQSTQRLRTRSRLPPTQVFKLHTAVMLDHLDLHIPPTSPPQSQTSSDRNRRRKPRALKWRISPDHSSQTNKTLLSKPNRSLNMWVPQTFLCHPNTRKECFSPLLCVLVFFLPLVGDEMFWIAVATVGRDLVQ